MLEIKFTATERLEIEVKEEEIPIRHYLRQPQRLVAAIADPTLIEILGQERYRLKMRSLNFMEIYHFQPTVVLKVWSQGDGKVYLESQDCQMIGIDYINDRFFLNLKGELTPQTQGNKTYLRGVANLEVKIDLPPALWLTPKYFLEMAGNGLLKSVLVRIKQRILHQLIQDYRLWVSSEDIQQSQENVNQLLTP